MLGVLVYYRPDLILSVVDAATAAQFEQMYSSAAESIGRTRDAGDDWTMFGFYIRNNVGVAFQCFASGLAAGLGSIFFLVYNGALFGAVAGYLAERGLGDTFFSFVVTHGSFELTAIVLSGAAGLKLGPLAARAGPAHAPARASSTPRSECVVDRLRRYGHADRRGRASRRSGRRPRGCRTT